MHNDDPVEWCKERRGCNIVPLLRWNQHVESSPHPKCFHIWITKLPLGGSDECVDVMTASFKQEMISFSSQTIVAMFFVSLYSCLRWGWYYHFSKWNEPAVQYADAKLWHYMHTTICKPNYLLTGPFFWGITAASGMHFLSNPWNLNNILTIWKEAAPIVENGLPFKSRCGQ